MLTVGAVCRRACQTWSLEGKVLQLVGRWVGTTAWSWRLQHLRCLRFLWTNRKINVSDLNYAILKNQKSSGAGPSWTHDSPTGLTQKCSFNSCTVYGTVSRNAFIHRDKAMQKAWPIWMDCRDSDDSGLYRKTDVKSSDCLKIPTLQWAPSVENGWLVGFSHKVELSPRCSWAVTHLSGSSSQQRPGRPCRWLLQPLRWGSCRAPGPAPQPSLRWRWQPFAPVWVSRGWSRSGTWSRLSWWGPHWSPAPSGSAWSIDRSLSLRSWRRRRSLEGRDKNRSGFSCHIIKIPPKRYTSAPESLTRT